MTYQIQFVDAPAYYFLYFNFHKITDDSVFVNHGTGFNSVPGTSDDERWNSLDEGWNGLYEIGTDLGGNKNYDIPEGTPAYGWEVTGPAPSTVFFTVRGREDGVMWKDFVFSQHDDHTAEELNAMAGIVPPQFVDFTYTQTDAATPGTGTISGTIDASAVGGPTDLAVSGPMPPATINQKGTTTEPVPDEMVGFIASGFDDNPGADSGVHLGWSGTVTLEGTDGGTTYSIEVKLEFPDETKTGVETEGSYEFVLTDDNSSVGGTNDAVGTAKVAGWVGNDGDGNRATGEELTWVVGADNITTDKSFSIDQYSWGDDLGITVSYRGLDAANFPMFVDQVTFSGVLAVDPDTLIPEPATMALLALGACLPLLRRRR